MFQPYPEHNLSTCKKGDKILSSMENIKPAFSVEKTAKQEVVKPPWTAQQHKKSMWQWEG